MAYPHSASEVVRGKSAAVTSIMDIVLVVLVSLAALALEDWARLAGYLTIGKEARGIFAVMAGVLTALALVVIRRQRFSDIGFRRPRRWWTVPLWVPGILGIFLAGQSVVPLLLGKFFELPAPDMSRYDNLYHNLPLVLRFALTVPLTSAIPEEIIYRGFLMDRLTRIFGAGIAGTVLTVLVQGALFGAAHFQWGVGGVLMTTIMGVTWGTAFVLCGRNIWIVILAHSAADLLLVGQLYFIKGSELAMG